MALIRNCLWFACFVCLAAPIAKVDAQFGVPLLRFRIEGTLFCTLDGSIDVNSTTTPVFPNASVQLQCGSRNVASVMTNGSGVFSIMLVRAYRGSPLTFVNNCSVVVNTPLANCNASLPSVGSLRSGLRVAETTFALLPLTVIFNVVPTGFIRIP